MAPYDLASVSPAFNYDRIRNHDDKVLLARIAEYFDGFANADVDKVNSMLADDYRMSNIRKSQFIFSLIKYISF